MQNRQANSEPRAGTLRRIAWDAVYDKLSNDPDYDPDIARNKADEVVRLMESGQNEQLAARRERYFTNYVNWMSKWVKRLVWTTVVTAAVYGIYYGIAAADRTRNNDYAHADPSVVADGAYYAIQFYYGENDLPPNLRMVRKFHSQIDGHAAWYTVWENPEGKKTCVFVWGHSQTGTPHGTYTKMNERCE